MYLFTKLHSACAMWKKYLQFVTILIVLPNHEYSRQRDMILCAAEKVDYITTERPKVIYYNTRYIAYMNLTSKRYGRRDPFYYVDLHFRLAVPFQKNVSIDFYFHEFLTNVYKPSFIEMHFEFCDMVHHDRFFGAPMRQGKLAKPCPYLPGEYNLYNMSIDIGAIPRGFPFRKGRIYCNITSRDTKDLMMHGYIDMEVKGIHLKKVKKNG